VLAIFGEKIRIPGKKILVKFAQALAQRRRQHARNAIDHGKSAFASRTANFAFDDFLHTVVGRIDCQVEFLTPAIWAAKQL
jgi:hypothetical protein